MNILLLAWPGIWFPDRAANFRLRAHDGGKPTNSGPFELINQEGNPNCFVPRRAEEEFACLGGQKSPGTTRAGPGQDLVFRVSGHFRQLAHPPAERHPPNYPRFPPATMTLVSQQIRLMEARRIARSDSRNCNLTAD